MTSRSALLWLLLLSPAPSLWARAAGQTGFLFLNLSPSARAAGMAGARSGVVGEVDAVHSNPAGLAHMRSPELSFTHVAHFEDTALEYIAFAKPSRRGAWAVSAGFMTVGNIPATRFDAAAPDRFIESGAVEAGAQIAAFSWGRRQTPRVALGMTIKAFRQALDEESVQSGAVDAGIVYRVDDRWRTALVAQNLGPAAKFSSESFSPPARYKAAAYYAAEDWIFWELEGVLNAGAGSELILGAEAQWERQAFLRLGYRYQLEDTDLGNLAGAALGLGGTWSTFRADYAFLPFGDLGQSHRLTLGWTFGGRQDRRLPSRRVKGL